jgi:hypothetical protein
LLSFGFGNGASKIMEQTIPRHIRLTSHPSNAGPGPGMMVPLVWGAASPELRGPVVASPAASRYRNAIGSHSGGYSVYRALAVATSGSPPASMRARRSRSPAPT